MVIDNYDSGTFRLVAVMIVGKAEINASGSFRIVTGIEEITCNG